ncbi:DUF6212 domain-containing protein [Falsirhodobacter deserti]|uniref:DUF6212 domain-containing protein n=1 Tax=Falsirhodobacter deserti TaxID=1365611 RepID=UPI000FE3D051|nr:DUF6212 domain-containing protein [Falsirhodobacter deserti]
MTIAANETLLRTLSEARPIPTEKIARADLRVRPLNLPKPVFLSDTSDCDGHVSTDYWQSEDAMYIHPPVQNVVCSVLRGVEIGRWYEMSAAVHASRQNGPVLSLAVGIAAAGAANATNWQDFMGTSCHVLPGRWAVVGKTIPADLMERRCDVLLSAQVLGRQGNHNAWALFRRFGFKIQDQNWD